MPRQAASCQRPCQPSSLHAPIGSACPCPPDRIVVRVKEPQLAVLGSILKVLRAPLLTVSDDHGAQALQQAAAACAAAKAWGHEAPGSRPDADGAALLQHVGPEAASRGVFQPAHASQTLNAMILPED